MCLFVCLGCGLVSAPFVISQSFIYSNLAISLSFYLYEFIKKCFERFSFIPLYCYFKDMILLGISPNGSISVTNSDLSGPSSPT